MVGNLSELARFKAPMRLLCFIGALFILWLPWAILIYIFLRHDRNLASILNYVVLFFSLLFLWRFWSQKVYGETQVFSRYGLVKSSKNSREFLRGLATGFCLCLSLFILEAVLGWIKVSPPSASLVKTAIAGLLSAVGIALVEELIFRGWLIDELKRDYSKQQVIWLASLIFALLHFLKPVAEIIRTAATFPALVLLGIILTTAKYSYGDRLGICIGIHAGLIWGYYVINVGELIQYTNKVPAWIIGIDGNPIAGVMGLIFLFGLLWIIKQDLV